MAKVYVNGEVIHDLEEHKKELREALEEATRRRGLLWKELKSDLELNDDDHYWRAGKCRAMAYTEERLGTLNERLEMIKQAEKAAS